MALPPVPQKPLQLLHCKTCGDEIQRRVIRPSECAKCQRAKFRLWAKESGAAKASGAVNTAIQAGRLPRASTLQCVDCGRPAAHWDHRDYNAPLDVVPVCVTCNKLRGPAKFICKVA